MVALAVPPPLTVHASTSTTREYWYKALVTLMRMRSVVVGAKVTVRLTRLLPVTVPSVTQALPFQPCTWKSVTPYRREGESRRRIDRVLPVILD